jgi:hypothetical protein
MAIRSDEELDRLEQARQNNLRKARGHLKTLAYLAAAFLALLLWLGGYAAGRTDEAAKRPLVRMEVTSKPPLIRIR